jgi:3-(3-hydroxy-phenyl)propionate hydroxylase
LSLARDFPFARALINSGRLSVPTAQSASPLDTPDRDGDWIGGPGPGKAMLDAPVGPRGTNGGWLIDRLGRDFSLLSFGADTVVAPAGVTGIGIAGNGLAGQRYDARPGTIYLIRPDRYVAARWRRHDPVAVSAALDRAMGRNA